jgi:hypothetical protein
MIVRVLQNDSNPESAFKERTEMSFDLGGFVLVVSVSNVPWFRRYLYLDPLFYDKKLPNRKDR